VPVSLLFLLFVGNFFGFVDEHAFVVFTSVIGVIVSISVAFLSAFVGDKRSKLFQEIMLAIAFLSPIIFGSIHLFVNVEPLYRLGFLASMSASCLNILCNKASKSVGILPSLDPQSPVPPSQTLTSPTTSHARKYVPYPGSGSSGSASQASTPRVRTPASTTPTHVGVTPANKRLPFKGSNNDPTPTRSFASDKGPSDPHRQKAQLFKFADDLKQGPDGPTTDTTSSIEEDFKRGPDFSSS